MKKFIFTLFTMLFVANASALVDNTNKLFVEPFTIQPGETKEVLVNLNNPVDAITSFECEFVLPEGIEIVSEIDGEDVYYDIFLGSRTNTRYHNEPAAKKQADGTIKVVVYSNSNKTFKNTSGDVLVLNLKAADNLVDGTYTLELKNQVICRILDGVAEDASNGDSFCTITVGAPSGIDALTTGAAGKKVYDLQGRQTNAKQRGVYIINGKKVMK